MAQIELKARNGKGFKYSSSASTLPQVSDTLLRRKFDADRPNEKWVSDISYIKVAHVSVYLAVIMGLFSRQIIDWRMDETITSELILDSFQMAVGKRKTEPGLILHSDRGVQYRSSDYQSHLLDNDIQSSMSHSGNGWDNAAMESFFARLKVQPIHAKSFNVLNDTYASVFEYIELFYNTMRRHSSIDYQSPKQYEQH